MRRFVPKYRTSITDNKQLVGKTICVNQAVHTKKNCLFWGVINAVLCLIASYDFYYTRLWFRTVYHLIEGAICVILAVNSVVYLFRYIRNSCFLEPVFVNARQKLMLGVKGDDPYIKVPNTPPVKMDTTSSLLDTPMNLSATSWLSRSTPLNTSLSPNFSMSSPSWVYYQGSPDCANISTDANRHRVSSMSPAMLATSSPDEPIQDELSLSQYLREFEGHEKSASVSMSVEQPSNLLSSFWTHPATRTTNDTSPMLRRCTYQMAPPTPPQASSDTAGGIVDSNLSPSSSRNQIQEMWLRVGVNPKLLTKWNSNLRMWISQTVLKRVVDEIVHVDQALLRQGLADVRIGAVGLERLKKTAQISAVCQNVPTLHSLIAFLEFTPHQEYVVSRIRELTKGGCMSDFTWNGGGSHQGKNWEDHLPTDAAIVLHMLSTYLDSQLLPLPTNPDGRPFTSQYVVREGQKPGPGLAICEVRASPPCYAVSPGGTDGMLRPLPGPSNMFHAILLFVHLVKTRDAAMLGRVNLGPSGINMLWIVES